MGESPLPDPPVDIQEVAFGEAVIAKRVKGVRTLPGQWVERKKQTPKPTTIGSRIQRAVNKGRGYVEVAEEIQEKQVYDEPVDLDDEAIHALRLRLHAEVIARRKLSLALKKELDRRR